MQLILINLTQIISLTLPLLIYGLAMILTLKIGILKSLDKPLDFNKKINGNIIFGKNKTFRGLFIIVISSVITTYFLHYLLTSLNLGFIHPVYEMNPLLLGLLFTVSYTFGELINSFIKRRKGIKPGSKNANDIKLQYFIDLSDGIIITGIFLAFFSQITISEAFFAVLIGIFMHLLTDLLMKKLTLKKNIY